MVSTGRQIAGFTVMELMVVVTIVGILAVIAAPNFSGLIAATRIKGVASDLHMALLKARSEAVKRNASVRVEKIDDDEPWTGGWQVVLADPPNTVLATTAAHEGISISVTDADGDPIDPDDVTYLRSGRPDSAQVQMTFLVNKQPAFVTASDKNDRCRTVTLGVSGLPSVKKVDCP